MAVFGSLELFVPGLEAELAGFPAKFAAGALVCAGPGQIDAALSRRAGVELVVFTLPRLEAADWPSQRAHAELWAFTRWAALAWAASGTRVNALGLAQAPALPGQSALVAGRAASQAPARPASAGDAAAALRLLWQARSMTGQLIVLG